MKILYQKAEKCKKIITVLKLKALFTLLKLLLSISKGLKKSKCYFFNQYSNSYNSFFYILF